ncbi:MAG: GAF domain-containing protein, partial [Candidatus Aureabacteria bacterium]|nr:GAF domain-containing protein [Candidatus Auribacterota bacterium]
GGCVAAIPAQGIALKELLALSEVSKLIVSKVDLDTLLDQVLKSSLSITGARRGSVMLLDGHTKELTIRSARGLSPTIVRQTRIRLGEGVAGRVAREGKPLLISDINRDRRITRRSGARYQTPSFISVPLVSLPLKVHGCVVGVINLSDKKGAGAFTERDLCMVSVFAGQAAVAIENARLFDLLRRSYMNTIQALVGALETKDKVTRDHSERVARFAVGMARELGLSRDKVEGLRMAAFLHDIGKLGIDIDILAKPGKLTKEEWKIVRRHPDASAKIIEGIQFIWDIIPFVRYHHERMDGRGFPRRLKGKQIPMGARILAVADAFEAMTAERPYKRARSKAAALRELQSLAGRRYDRRVVRALVRALGKRSLIRDQGAPWGWPRRGATG